MDIVGWLVTNWMVPVIIAAVILLGFVGYVMDRKKYEQYRQEIINEEYAANTLQAVPGINEVADVIPANDNYGYDQGGYDQGGYDQGGYDQGYYDQGAGVQGNQPYDPGYQNQGPMM